MEVTGILIKKTNERNGISQQSGMPWRKAEFLVEIPGQFPKHINFSVSDGQVGRIARFESLIGKNVTVNFDIDAHEWQGRWFNELNAWGIMEYVDSTTRKENIAAAQAQKPETDAAGMDEQPQESQAGAVSPFPEPGQTEGKDDDLPF